MILGVTGCPGSGKSVLVEIIAGQGWTLVNADLIGRDVVEDSSDVKTQLAGEFGNDIINSDGELNRRLLARRAFSVPEKIRKLNAIVHPLLIRKLKERVLELRPDNINTVVDCALIFEWEIEDLFDVIVCVSADENTRKQRIMDRDRRTPAEIRDIFSAQLIEYEKMSKADIVITNNKSVEKMKIYGMLLSELPAYYKSTNNVS